MKSQKLLIIELLVHVDHHLTLIYFTLRYKRIIMIYVPRYTKGKQSEVGTQTRMKG